MQPETLNDLGSEKERAVFVDTENGADSVLTWMNTIEITDTTDAAINSLLAEVTLEPRRVAIEAFRSYLLNNSETDTHSSEYKELLEAAAVAQAVFMTAMEASEESDMNHELLLVDLFGGYDGDQKLEDGLAKTVAGIIFRKANALVSFAKVESVVPAFKETPETFVS